MGDYDLLTFYCNVSNEAEMIHFLTFSYPFPVGQCHTTDIDGTTLSDRKPMYGNASLCGLNLHLPSPRPENTPPAVAAIYLL